MKAKQKTNPYAKFYPPSYNRAYVGQGDIITNPPPPSPFPTVPGPGPTYDPNTGTVFVLPPGAVAPAVPSTALLVVLGAAAAAAAYLIVKMR